MFYFILYFKPCFNGSHLEVVMIVFVFCINDKKLIQIFSKVFRIQTHNPQKLEYCLSDSHFIVKMDAQNIVREKKR